MTTAARASLEHPGLLPSALLAPRRDSDAGSGLDGPPGPRTGRDWFVDVLCVVLSVIGGVALFVGERATRPEGVPLAISLVDIAAGLLGAVVKDPVQDRIVWQEYLETVVRDRRDWSDLYQACRELG